MPNYGTSRLRQRRLIVQMLGITRVSCVVLGIGVEDHLGRTERRLTRSVETSMESLGSLGAAQS